MTMFAPPAPPAPPSNRGLWVGLAIGGLVMAYGIRGVLVDAGQTHPTELARWVIGVALLHDLVVVPAALATATVLRRTVSSRLWPILRWALVTSAVLTAFSIPLVRGYGRNATVPSLLNRNYAAALVAYLVAVWILAAIVIAVVVLRRRPHAH